MHRAGEKLRVHELHGSKREYIRCTVSLRNVRRGVGFQPAIMPITHGRQDAYATCQTGCAYSRWPAGTLPKDHYCYRISKWPIPWPDPRGDYGCAIGTVDMSIASEIVRTGRKPVTAQAASGGWALRRADRVMNGLSPKYPPRVRRN